MNNDDIIKAARERMSEAIEADRDNREEALDDLQNLAGVQWPEDIRQQRETEGRPVLTINTLPRFTRQVTGDIRRLNPAVKVIPADGKASPEIAEIYAGLIRQIEYHSDASSVYEGAAENAAQCGMGAFRILSQYCDDDSFDQELLIKRIHNPFSVYWDPAAREPTREDAGYCFVTEQVKAEDFKAMYPDKAVVDADHDAETDGMQHWHEGDSVVVAEYFWKQPEKRKIYLMRDGSVIGQDQFIEGMDAVKSREVDAHKVMWAKVSGKDVLEGPTEYPCKHIPVVACVGEELYVGEEVIRTSVIRFAKDPQRLYNYFSSADAEFVALQPKAPYVGTAKQFQGFERFWNEANTSNRPYLPYNPDEKAPGAPQRQMPPQSSQGMVQQFMKAKEDLQDTTGIYNAALGQKSNETSGVAIRQRQVESDVGNSIYTDNLGKSIGHCGRILVDMIPKIYDTNRIVRIVGDDDEEKMVEINGMSFDLVEGAQPINPLGHGKYDVRVTVGPNYSTRRQETQEGMMQFVQAFPIAGQVAGDLIAKAMDWPDADKLAERLKKTLPPGMIDPADMSPEEQQAMQAQQQQQMQAMQAQQAMQQQMHETEMRKADAEATEAQADAQKAGADAQAASFDVMLKQLEVSAQTGEIQAVIQQAVQQALMAQMQQQPPRQF